MRRKKRLTIIRIGLAMAAAAIVPVTAQARPMPTDSNGSDRGYQLMAAPIPYLSHGQGVDSSEFGYGSAAEYRQRAVPVKRIVVPYLSQGTGVTSSELGYTDSRASDDRVFSRVPIDEATPITADGGSTFDVNPYVVTGFGVAFLLALGMGLAIRHSRRTKLTPA